MTSDEEIDHVLKIIEESIRIAYFYQSIKELVDKMPDPKEIIKNLEKRHKKISTQKILIGSNCDSVN